MTPPDGYRSVAYFVNWAIYGRKHRPQDLPVENLTHVLYAFAKVSPDNGEVSLTDVWADTDIHYEGDSWNDSGTNLYGCLKQLNVLKKRKRSLKLLLSIGGWTLSSSFPSAASTPSSRANFASSSLTLLKNLGLDGLDIDWEYPSSPQQASDFVLLLQECRRQLDEYAHSLGDGVRFELTVASPAGIDKARVMDIRGMDRVLDAWHLMAYDYAGSWDTLAGHQANLFASPSQHHCTPFNTEDAVRYYESQGVATHKIVLGMPLYGRAFEGTDGVGRPFQGTGEGTWENGVHDFKKLPLEGAQEFLDEQIGASGCYDAQRKKLVSYDTVEMARRKATYIKQRGLGGAMWWESSADREGDESLIKNVVGVLGHGHLENKQNCIRYPDSKYENLRNGL